MISTLLYMCCFQNVINKNDITIPQPGVLHLSAANIDRHGAYLLDTGSRLFLWIGAAVSDLFCQEIFDVPNFSAIQDGQVHRNYYLSIYLLAGCIRRFWLFFNASKIFVKTTEMIFKLDFLLCLVWFTWIGKWNIR